MGRGMVFVRFSVVGVNRLAVIDETVGSSRLLEIDG